ncbi:hypothetical protein [Paludisphaera rhizosphaerae]|uniref:hypothetical protein n=1 Tax=Paludisphaera rhizosphaerae TaxID=2711216 RepID=UPI0013ECE3A9|nr:hypothetical protein [Paludisphaera rhizosphaerae]
MARRPSVQEILEAARRGGQTPAESQKPAAPSPSPPAPEPTPKAAGPQPRLSLQEKLGQAQLEREARAGASTAEPARRLTLQEKLDQANVERGARIAARNGAAASSDPVVADVPAAPGRLTLREKLEKARAERKPATILTAPAPAQASAAAPAAAAAAPGRKLTLQEKLAAARGEGSPAATPPPAAPAPAPTAPAGKMSVKDKLAAARGLAAQPVPQKPATAPAETSPVASPAADRELPPLGEITDTKDLAEALRRTGAKKAEEAATRPPAATIVVRPIFDHSAAPARPSAPDVRIEPPIRSQVHVDGRGMLIYATWWTIAGWVGLGAVVLWLLRLLATGSS